MGHIDNHDAVALAALVRSGEVSSRELVAEAIHRLESVEPALNAVVHRQYERALRDAEAVRPGDERPLAGVPFLLKDYGAAEAGETYHMNVRPARDAGYRPSVDSELAMRFRAAGMIPIARTNTPQMALMGTTEPELSGPTHNPWDLGRTPGGSSGGSAALVAARVVPAAHANDISGSIRIPAAMCGLVGLKPTRGRTIGSTNADRPVGMNTEGVVSRSVRDSAVLFDAISHRSAWWPAPALAESLAVSITRPLGPVRVAVWTEAFNGAQVDPANAAAARDAASVFAESGCSVVESAPPELSDPELWDLAKDAMAATAACEADAWETRLGRPLAADDLEARSWAMIEAGRALSAPRLLAILERMQQLSASAATWWADVDLLVTPTTAAGPGPLGEYLTNYASGRGSAFTRPFNVTGQPAVSVPIGWPDDGLPRGVQLAGAYGRDDLVLCAAAVLEQALPWADRRPPVCAH